MPRQTNQSVLRPVITGCWENTQWHRCHRGLSCFSPSKSYWFGFSPLISMPASTRFLSVCPADIFFHRCHHSGFNAGWKTPTWSHHGLSRGFYVFILWIIDDMDQRFLTENSIPGVDYCPREATMMNLSTETMHFDQLEQMSYHTCVQWGASQERWNVKAGSAPCAQFSPSCVRIASPSGPCLAALKAYYY